jgi:hypothetical protein
VERSGYLRVSSLILLCLLLGSCSSWPKLRQIEVKTIEVDRVIPTQTRPQPINLHDITWFVVTEQNFKDFKARYTKQNGTFLFYAISVRDYETLALNMAEIKRYVDQQRQIIVYYEKAVAPKPKKEPVLKKK